jgi:hypothetical protein
MWNRLRLLLLCIAVLLAAGSAPAQIRRQTETRNAALRYWLAFAEMQDSPSDPSTAALLEKTAAGEVPWDESKLGSILDKNEHAILQMQRATKLPDCDWGVEYSDGPTASIAYGPKARVLARLNTLYGMRQATKGNQEAAVQTWLAGVRFSQHIAQGGSLIFALTAKSALLSNLRALTQAAQSGWLSPAEKVQAKMVILALPESAFDWSSALLLEEDGIDIALDDITHSANPDVRYVELIGSPAAPNTSYPSDAERAAFHQFMLRAQTDFRLTPAQTAAKLSTLQSAQKSLHPFYQVLIPSLARVNGARAEIADARQQFLGSL